MRRSVPICFVLGLALVGCSHSSKASVGSAATTIPGAASTVAGANGTGPQGTGANGSAGTVAHSAPSTTAPSQAVWVRTHAAGLKSLKSSLDDVANAFAKKDDAALSKALAACANVATPLARTAAGSLPNAQADALGTVADQCASITHLIKSGDTAGIAAARPVLDAAVSTLAPTFAAAGA